MSREIKPIYSEVKQKEFEDLCRPIIKWINDNGDPHIVAMITYSSCELLGGLFGVTTDDYIL